MMPSPGPARLRECKAKQGGFGLSLLASCRCQAPETLGLKTLLMRSMLWAWNTGCLQLEGAGREHGDHGNHGQLLLPLKMRKKRIPERFHGLELHEVDNSGSVPAEKCLQRKPRLSGRRSTERRDATKGIVWQLRLNSLHQGRHVVLLPDVASLRHEHI